MRGGARFRTQLPRRDDERERNQSENAEAVLDDGETGEPENHPRNDRRRHHPPPEVDAGDELQRDRDAAQFCAQQEEIEKELGAEKQQLEMKSQALPHRGRERSSADGSETPAHFGEHGEDERRHRNGPQQPQPELGSGLRRRRERSHFNEAADAGDHSESDVADLPHTRCRTVRASVRSPRDTASYNSAAMRERRAQSSASAATAASASVSEDAARLERSSSASRSPRRSATRANRSDTRPSSHACPTSRRVARSESVACVPSSTSADGRAQPETIAASAIPARRTLRLRFDTAAELSLGAQPVVDVAAVRAAAFQ